MSKEQLGEYLNNKSQSDKATTKRIRKKFIVSIFLEGTKQISEFFFSEMIIICHPNEMWNFPSLPEIFQNFPIELNDVTNHHFVSSGPREVGLDKIDFLKCTIQSFSRIIFKISTDKYWYERN